MLLTQADAEDYYCPFDKGNSPAIVPGGCCGSSCMMWRWYEPPKTDTDKLFPNDDRRGYCGLAGKPEYA